jgi:hypothetical protein
MYHSKVALLGVLVATDLILASSAAGAESVQQCSTQALLDNLKVSAEIRPNQSSFLIQSPDPQKSFVSSEKRIPCTEADLMTMGFDLKTAYRTGPADSTNGAFESVAYYQHGPVLVACYNEMTLSDRSDAAQVLSTRSACQQVVQPRLMTVGRTAASPAK